MIERPSKEEILQAREQFDLSQREAGILANVDDSTWTRWELGTRNINLASWELFQLKTGMIKLETLKIN